MGRETAVLELARAIEKYGTGAKHDLTSVALRTEYSHGPGGQLTWPGVDPLVFNAAMGPESILSQIPTKESVFTDPTYAILTGVQDDIGENKSAPCDDAPVAGLMKSCIQHAPFGRYEVATDQIEINRLGQRTDRADPLDLSLIGSPIGNAGIFGNADPATPLDLLTSEFSRLIYERNVAFFRILARQLIVGSPANNAALGGYKELTGIQTLVNTGHVDALTGVACPAVDSYIRNFNYARIDTNGGNTVAEVTNIWYQLRFRARRMNLMPVRWIVVMREQLFYALTEIWPCAYSTYRCTTSAGNQATADAMQMVNMRDAMRAGNYLLIDGQQVDVVFDDGIPESTATTQAALESGCFASDIYFLPMSVVGARSVLYLEYFQYDNADIRKALQMSEGVVVEGAFLTWSKRTNECLQWQSKIEPRLVLRAPYLAARLQNVGYCPVEHVRDAFPDDPYFVNGGQVSRPGPSYYQGLW